MPHRTKAARKAYQAKWATEINPVARKDAWNRYARAHQAENTVAHVERAKAKRARTWARSSGVCFFCPEILDEATFVVDHRMPRSRGGVDDERNRVATCRRCNARKRDKTASEFRSWLRARGELPALPTDADGTPLWLLSDDPLADEDADRALAAPGRVE